MSETEKDTGRSIVESGKGSYYHTIPQEGWFVALDGFTGKVYHDGKEVKNVSRININIDYNAGDKIPRIELTVILPTGVIANSPEAWITMQEIGVKKP